MFYIKKLSNRQKTLWICVTAMFTGLNIIASTFNIPVPGGHLYINDIIICTAAILLDPVGAFVVGGIGAFLGDAFFYPTPMFVSLVTHGLQAVAISLISHNTFSKKPIVASITGVAVGAVIMVTGYTFGRAYVYGTPVDAALKLPYQVAQALLGAVTSIVLCYGLRFKRIYAGLSKQNLNNSNRDG